MKIPKPRKLKNGYAIYLRIGGVALTPIKAETERECRRLAAIAKAQAQEACAAPLNPADITLREACARYIARMEQKRRSPATIRGYTAMSKSRFQSAMDTPVRSIRDWQALYDMDAETAGFKTMRNAVSFFRTVCRTECGVVIPKIDELADDRTEHLFLEPEQIPILIKSVAGRAGEIGTLLALSGLRRSEICGLTWADVDLDAGKIRVRQALVYDKSNQAVLKSSTKTRAGTREVPIFIPELRAALEAVQNREGRVVPYAPNSIYKMVVAALERADLPPVGLHGLRHTFASLCYHLGLRALDTQRLGGWDDPGTVQKIYTHLAARDRADAQNKLETFFKNATENATENKKH